MADPSEEHAAEVVHSLRIDVARFVFEEGVRHTQALQTAAHAIDARATQIATILFAAAALAAGVIGTTVTASSILAVISTSSFIIGGLITFRAVKSTAFHPPGLAPAWWWEGVMPRYAGFSESDALAWAAKQQQIVINSVCKENEARARAINRSLWFAVGGAVTIGLAAGLRLWPAADKLVAACL